MVLKVENSQVRGVWGRVIYVFSSVGWVCLMQHLEMLVEPMGAVNYTHSLNLDKFRLLKTNHATHIVTSWRGLWHFPVIVDFDVRPLCRAPGDPRESNFRGAVLRGAVILRCVSKDTVKAIQ